MTNLQRSVADRLPQVGQAVDLVALGRSGRSICCRTRIGAINVLVPLGVSPVRPVEGELFTLEVARRSRNGSFWVLEGPIQSPRLEAEALGLEPLALIPRAVTSRGGAGGESGGGRHYELETIIPRVPGFPASGYGAVDEIAAFWDSGDRELAELLAGELLARDLRCLEAHALLGGFFLNGPVEERWTERALRHYRVGVTIGELSLAGGFDGLLPWRWRGNRAFARCLYGYACCLERVGDAGPGSSWLERLRELAPDCPMCSDGGREAATSPADDEPR